MPSRRTLARALVVAAPLALACSPARQAPVPAPLAPPLVIAAPAVQPFAGASIPLRVHDAHATDAVQWSATPFRRAWISPDGTLTLLEPGTVTVRVSDGIREGTHTLTVLANRAARLVMEQRVVTTAQPGDTVRIAGHVYDREGARIADAPVAYGLVARGAAPDDASVTVDGRFVAARPGIYTVIAECGGVSGRTIVIVESDVDRAVRALRAGGFAALGAGGPPRRHDAADRGDARDRTRAARGDSAARTLAPVTIAAARTSRVTIDDTGDAAYDGTTIPLSARVWVGGQRRPDSTARVVWGTSDPAIAHVTQDGQVVFLAPGWVTVTAAHGGMTSTKRFNVRWHPAAALALRPGTPDVHVGTPVRFREDVWQRGGYPVVDARVNYAIIAHGVEGPVPASMSERRVFTARRAGAYTVIAEVGGVADKFTMYVREASVAAR